MESVKIDILLEKYFQGETSIDEENELKNYFLSPDVAQHLTRYKPMFEYFATEKKQRFQRDLAQFMKNRDSKGYLKYVSIAASAVILLGIGTYSYINYNNVKHGENGTYDNPEIAFKETQKALALLSSHVNVGIESVQYIQEYEDSKNLIFKQ